MRKIEVRELQISISDHQQIAAWSSVLKGGKIVTSVRRGSIITSVYDKNNWVYGETDGHSMKSTYGLMYVLDSIARDTSTSGMGDRLGTFIGYCGLLALVDWAKNIDGNRNFWLALHAPPGKPWNGLREAYNLNNIVELQTSDKVTMRLPARKID